MKQMTGGVSIVVCAVLWALPAHAIEGDAGRGARVFGTCAPCHSLEADRNMTGPSLAYLWNRKAGALPSFSRYSSALRSSEVIWDDITLDAWVHSPEHFIPGNTMTFAGIEEERARADLIAFLRQATSKGQGLAQSAQMGGMSGMMGGSAPNLKKLSPQQRVQTIRYCGDTFSVTTGDGKTRAFWERNLRFKTDSSNDGPEKDAPAIVASGMMGDRASVIFAAPEEIAQFIRRTC